MESIPILMTNEIVGTPTIETRSQIESIGDDPMSQIMLRVLEKVAETRIGPVAQGLVTERLRSNWAELFKGVTGLAPTVAKYWLEATKRIINDLNCTPAQKLRDGISLLYDEAYQWWLTAE